MGIHVTYPVHAERHSSNWLETVSGTVIATPHGALDGWPPRDCYKAKYKKLRASTLPCMFDVVGGHNCVCVRCVRVLSRICSNQHGVSGQSSCACAGVITLVMPPAHANTHIITCNSQRLLRIAASERSSHKDPQQPGQLTPLLLLASHMHRRI